LGSVFLRLGARLNWHELFQELIQGFDTQVLAEKQRVALAQAGLPDPHPVAAG
jgi:hypothetical protein